MKIVDGFVLRTIGSDSVVVGEGIGQVNFNKIISLNSSAKFLWESIEGKEFTTDTLAELLIQEYEIDADLAKTDAEKIANDWLSIGIIK